MVVKEKHLCEKIFEVIRERIVRMDYPPGMNLSEKELCQEFKVSRTPLREAIRKLEDMKLVTVIPRFGTHVSDIDINKIRCAFEVKVHLEGLSAMYAAKRISENELGELEELVEATESLAKSGDKLSLIEVDDAFHAKVWESTQNSILIEFLENIHSQCARLWNSNLGDQIYNADVAEQIENIFSAIKNRQADKARQLAEDHVQYFIEKIKGQLL